MSRLCAAVLTLAAAATAVFAAQAPPRWPDTFTSRLEVLALIQTLNANVLASRSSTATLEAWCRDHAMAAPAEIAADAIPGAPATPSAEQLRRLDVTSATEIKYRHVRLRCGTHVFSEADNWYVPARLSVEMNRQLDGTRAPFGRVVAPLEPYRRTFSMILLWSPLPPGWERVSAAAPHNEGRAMDIPAALFEHRAVLYASDNRPFSEVRETYQRGILEFAPAR